MPCFASVLPLVKVQEETDGADGVVACREGGLVATREVGGVPTSLAVCGRSGSVLFPAASGGNSLPSFAAPSHRSWLQATVRRPTGRGAGRSQEAQAAGGSGAGKSGPEPGLAPAAREPAPFRQLASR